MARLIDADALNRTLRPIAMDLSNEYGSLGGAVSGVIKHIDNAPDVDAVEVVRCKDCKHYRPQKKSAHWENRANYCNRVVTIKTQPDDFCSYGERKESDENG